ncbi:MAG: hypothetical protein QM770_18610 [Tepidisphaeraceae bacterium]
MVEPRRLLAAERIVQEGDTPHNQIAIGHYVYYAVDSTPDDGINDDDALRRTDVRTGKTNTVRLKGTGANSLSSTKLSAFRGQLILSIYDRGFILNPGGWTTLWRDQQVEGKVQTAIGLGWFVANGGSLWRTDGTPEGTYVTRLAGGSDHTEASLSDAPIAFGKRIYFRRYSAGYYHSAWYSSDGRSRGMRKENWFSEAQVEVNGVIPMKSKLALVTQDPVNGAFIFVADGTTAHPTAISDVKPVYSVTPAAAVGDQLVWVGTTTKWGAEIYLSDGTAAGTRRITDIRRRGKASFASPILTAIDGGVYVASRDTSSDSGGGVCACFTDLLALANSADAEPADLQWVYHVDVSTGEARLVARGRVDSLMEADDTLYGLNADTVTRITSDGTEAVTVENASGYADAVVADGKLVVRQASELRIINPRTQVSAIHVDSFVDSNDNGRFDPYETGTLGDDRAVWLDADGDGRPDKDEVRADRLGGTMFRFLPPGRYRVGISKSLRYESLDSRFVTVDLTAGDDEMVRVRERSGMATLTATIFRDANRNGVRDARERPLSGVRLRFYDAANDFWSSSFDSDSDGVIGGYEYLLGESRRIDLDPSEPYTMTTPAVTFTVTSYHQALSYEIGVD